MRHQHVGGVAALRLNADLARLRAKMFVAAPADRALAAADPWINHIAFADGDAAHIRPHGCKLAFDFMTKRKRKRPAAGKFRASSAAEIEIAFMQVNVGMTDAAMTDANQHFGAFRLGHCDDFFAKRLAVVGKNLAHDFCHLSSRLFPHPCGEAVCKPHETLDRNFLCALGRFDLRFRKQRQRIDPERAQALA